MKNPRRYPDTMASAESGRPMRRGVKRLTIEIDDIRFSYNQPGWWCSLDDPDDLEGQLVDQDNKIRAAALSEARAAARAHGRGELLAITPLAIRAIREKCGLSQRQAAKVFGGGAKAFEKYEAGEIIPTGAMRRLLALAARRPELFKGQTDELAQANRDIHRIVGQSSVAPLWEEIYGPSKTIRKPSKTRQRSNRSTA